jgi:hypothetical protein
MSRKPKDGAKTWSLNIREVPIDLYWIFSQAAGIERMEFGKWALGILEKAANEVLQQKPTKKRKHGV